MSSENLQNWTQINILIVDDNNSPLCPIFDSLGAKYHQCFTIGDADATLINATLRHKVFHLICINTSDQNSAMSVFINALGRQSYYRRPGIITYTDNFHSENQAGSFIDTIAKTLKRSQTQAKQSLALFSTSKPSILLVEDNEINQKIILMMLRNITDKIDICDTGNAAITKAQEQDYDCVLLDIGLPDTNGFKVAKALRSMEATAELPIIAVTAYISDREIASCFKSGVNDIITKPIEFEQLKLAMAYTTTSKLKEYA